MSEAERWKQYRDECLDLMDKIEAEMLIPRPQANIRDVGDITQVRYHLQQSLLHLRSLARARA